MSIARLRCYRMSSQGKLISATSLVTQNKHSTKEALESQKEQREKKKYGFKLRIVQNITDESNMKFSRQKYQKNKTYA